MAGRRRVAFLNGGWVGGGGVHGGVGDDRRRGPDVDPTSPGSTSEPTTIGGGVPTLTPPPRGQRRVDDDRRRGPDVDPTSGVNVATSCGSGPTPDPTPRGERRDPPRGGPPSGVYAPNVGNRQPCGGTPDVMGARAPSTSGAAQKPRRLPTLWVFADRAGAPRLPSPARRSPAPPARLTSSDQYRILYSE